MPKQKLPNKKQDKNQLKRAALFYWSHSINVAAEKACTAVGGFKKTEGAGARFYCVVTKMKAFIKELNAIADAKECKDAKGEQHAQRLRSVRSRARLSTTEGYGCTMDEHCPDGQICIYGDCESPFS